MDSINRMYILMTKIVEFVQLSLQQTGKIPNDSDINGFIRKLYPNYRYLRQDIVDLATGISEELPDYYTLDYAYNMLMRDLSDMIDADPVDDCAKNPMCPLIYEIIDFLKASNHYPSGDEIGAFIRSTITPGYNFKFTDENIQYLAKKMYEYEPSKYPYQWNYDMLRIQLYSFLENPGTMPPPVTEPPIIISPEPSKSNYNFLIIAGVIMIGMLFFNRR
jgi:hypothetical protein